MILQSRGFPYESQSKVYKECKDGFIERDLFEEFLQKNKYPLHCLDFHVRESSLKEFEQLVYAGLNSDCDILVSVAYELLIDVKQELNHTLILTEYDCHSERAILIDPARERVINCGFSLLMTSLFTVSGAFHIFHQDLSLLKDLNERYF